MSIWKIWPLAKAAGKPRLMDSPPVPPNSPQELPPAVLMSAVLLKLLQLGSPLLLLAALARKVPPPEAPTVQAFAPPALECLYQANDGDVPEAAAVNVTVEPLQLVCARG